MRSGFGLAALVLALELTASAGFAQGAQPGAAVDDAAVIGYREAIDQAVAEHATGNFGEARALFHRAHLLYPNARTLRGLGMMEFELKRYAESIAFLEQALASGVRPLGAELRAQTETLLERAKGFVGRYDLTLRPALESAQVIVDGVPAASMAGAGRRLTLTVGEHVLEVRAEGYHDEKRVVSVKGGEYQLLAIALRPQRSAPAAATRAAPTEDEGSAWSSPWLWTGIGALVAGGVITALLLAGGDDAGELERGDVGGVVTTLRRRR